jgi:cyclopropane fatty-acyl-phospholipid synthase-like methyltransferase
MSAAPNPRPPGTSAALRVAAGAPVPADVAKRLQAGGRALEVDCGGGLGCLALAEAFPAAGVLGLDRDAAAVARAQRLAGASGLDGRVRFGLAGTERLPRSGFDLATVRAVSAREDALQVLNTIRNALVPTGVCLLVEPIAAEVRARDASAQEIDALARRAGFASCELTCREPDLDVFELRR